MKKNKDKTNTKLIKNEENMTNGLTEGENYGEGETGRRRRGRGGAELSRWERGGRGDEKEERI